MTVMSKDYYACPICGKDFLYKKSMKKHKKSCGLKPLDEFDDGFRELKAQNNALRRNDYNNQDTKSTRQTKFRVVEPSEAKNDITSGKSALNSSKEVND